jgi:nicotinamide-nucleotide amidase
MIPAGCEDADLERLAVRVGRKLLATGRHLATAESCTGGWIAKAITDVPGSSAWFLEGFVTYSNGAKLRELRVPTGELERHGAVSEAVARSMAAGALKRAGSDLTVAVTGIAGPGGGSPGKPVGTVWFCWASTHPLAASKRGVARRGARSGMLRRVQLQAEVRHFRGDREAVRRKTVRIALLGLLRLLPAIRRAGGAHRGRRLRD